MTPESLESYVFPLPNAVLFPRMTIPLNIFEPRYVQMVNDSLKSGRPIALAQQNPVARRTTKPERIVAGFGNPEILYRRPDDTMVILLCGAGKGQVGDVLGTEPYLTCELKPIEEQSDLRTENRFVLNRLRKMYFDWIEKNVSNPQQKKQLSVPLEAPQMLLEAFSMVLVPEPKEQQTILEIDDVNDRLEFLKKYL